METTTVKGSVHCRRRAEAMSNETVSNWSAGNIPVADISMTRIAMHPAAAIGPIRMTVPWTTAPTVSPTPVPQPSGTMEPRARTYEHTSRKPVSTVISIRRTRVRVVAVIAVGTDRRRSHGNSDRSHSNSDPNSHLRLRVRHRDRQHRQHCKILCVFHNPLRFPTPPSRAHYRALLFVISLPFHHSHHLLNLNIAARKKLHKSRWLISAMLVVFSHLRGMCSDVARAMHDALTGTASAKLSQVRAGYFREGQAGSQISGEARNVKSKPGHPNLSYLAPTAMRMR
jgi:hypothetical protein